MEKGKLAVFILGAAIVLGAAWYYLKATAEVTGDVARAYSNSHTQARQQLDNVREAAQKIEDEGKRRADEAGREPPKE